MELLVFILFVAVIYIVKQKIHNKKEYEKMKQKYQEKIELEKRTKSLKKINEVCKIEQEIKAKEKNYKKYKSFEKKEYLLTTSELKFYKILKKITDELNLNIFTQVGLYEIIRCNDYKDFNRIKSKTIDFVITNNQCKIIKCIELDDYTHNQIKRIERIDLIRIPVQNYYKKEDLKKEIFGTYDYINNLVDNAI